MRDKRQANVRTDLYTRTCLTAITVLLTLLVVGLFSDTIDPVGRAEAGPTKYTPTGQKAISGGRWGTSSAAEKTAAQQTQTNAKLDQLISLLKTGNAKVRIVGSEGVGQGGVNVPKTDTSQEP